MCHVSRCYQRGLPHLVFNWSPLKITSSKKQLSPTGAPLKIESSKKNKVLNWRPPQNHKFLLLTLNQAVEDSALALVPKL